jgi:hypothetical protein
METRLAAIALFIVLAGCNRRIPNSIRPDEYVVYAEWLQAHFAKEAPANLYINSRTFVFDPFQAAGCANAIDDHKAGVPWALIKQLHALGEAEYRIPEAYSSTTLRIPWSYKLVDDWRLVLQDSGTYRLVGFSRVAFNAAHSKAFFAFSDACGGLCGRGGAVYAHKQNGAWVFESVGCNWLY